MGMNGRFYGVYEVHPWRGVLVAMEAHYPQGWGRWWGHFEWFWTKAYAALWEWGSGVLPK